MGNIDIVSDMNDMIDLIDRIAVCATYSNVRDHSAEAWSGDSQNSPTDMRPT